MNGTTTTSSYDVASPIPMPHKETPGVSPGRRSLFWATVFYRKSFTQLAVCAIAGTRYTTDNRPLSGPKRGAHAKGKGTATLLEEIKTLK